MKTSAQDRDPQECRTVQEPNIVVVAVQEPIGDAVSVDDGVPTTVQHAIANHDRVTLHEATVNPVEAIVQMVTAIQESCKD